MGKKYHYFYKTTNKVNGKYYFGIHSTNDLDDGYLGSGTKLWYARQKYGDENFSKEILKFFNTREEASLYESQQVNTKLLQDPNCYNLRTGGDVVRLPGGCLSEEVVRKARETHKLHMQDPEFRKRDHENRSKANRGRIVSEETRRKLSEARKGIPGYVRGIPKSEEHRQKISESLTGRHLSDEHKAKLRKPKMDREAYRKTPEHIQKILETRRRNGTFKKSEKDKQRLSEIRKGRVWICKLGENGEQLQHIVPKDKVQTYLEQGYVVGKFKRKHYSRKPASAETKQKISKTLSSKVWMRKVEDGKLIDRQSVTKGPLEQYWLDLGYEYGKELPKIQK